jgi:hypothetical protein
MLRIALIAAFAFAACANAVAQEQTAPEEQPAPQDQAREIHRDGFVWSNDACGASQYDHLVGEPHAELHDAALPANANIWDFSTVRTLEFKPGQLNVVLNGEGRIIAIGCF